MNNFFAYLKKEEDLHYSEIAEFLDVVSEHVRLHHPSVYAQVVEEFKKNSISHQRPASPAPDSLDANSSSSRS